MRPGRLAGPRRGSTARAWPRSIRGESDGVRDTVFLAYRDVQRSVRQGDWKLIRYPQINRSQLFNLKDDPAETKDLAGDPRHADKLDELTALLEAEQKRHDDTLWR